MEQFEPISLSECDSCREPLWLNKDGLCKICDAATKAFNKAAQGVRRNGGTREDAYKAGDAASNAIYAMGQMSESLSRARDELTAKAAGVL